MTLDTIWVFAETSEGQVTSTTLELLTKARELADTVACVERFATSPLEDAAALELARGGGTLSSSGLLSRVWRSGAKSCCCRPSRRLPLFGCRKRRILQTHRNLYAGRKRRNRARRRFCSGEKSDWRIG